jgi:hypothetical protein
MPPAAARAQPRLDVSFLSRRRLICLKFSLRGWALRARAHYPQNKRIRLWITSEFLIRSKALIIGYFVFTSAAIPTVRPGVRRPMSTNTA